MARGLCYIMKCRESANKCANKCFHANLAINILLTYFSTNEKVHEEFRSCCRHPLPMMKYSGEIRYSVLHIILNDIGEMIFL